MEVRTITLDGQDYALIPKEIFERMLGIEEVKSEQNLDDFGTPKPLRLANKEEQRESIVVVDKMPDIKRASGSQYGYATRLKEHKLIPEDVMVTNTKFEDMPEIPEIARNDYKKGYPPGKFGFYGPGAERDLG